ncbi:hypothetical protein J1614_009428 [Plenodomus biglobosus]|nr:hypothetical protein J1614_009428 [Plenodomus biglobosus]
MYIHTLEHNDQVPLAVPGPSLPSAICLRALWPGLHEARHRCVLCPQPSPPSAVLCPSHAGTARRVLRPGGPIPKSPC